MYGTIVFILAQPTIHFMYAAFNDTVQYQNLEKEIPEHALNLHKDKTFTVGQLIMLGILYVVLKLRNFVKRNVTHLSQDLL